MTTSAPTLEARPFATGSRAGFVAGLKAAVAGLWHSYWDRRRLSPLLELDDRLLRDIGLTREDVEAALSSSWDENASRMVAHRARRG